MKPEVSIWTSYYEAHLNFDYVKNELKFLIRSRSKNKLWGESTGNINECLGIGKGSGKGIGWIIYSNKYFQISLIANKGFQKYFGFEESLPKDEPKMNTESIEEVISRLNKRSPDPKIHPNKFNVSIDLADINCAC